MKYMILSYASQRDYDSMSGKDADGLPAWTEEDLTAMGEFMTTVNKELEESGELVETRGLAAPVHTRRVGARDGQPFVTDGPYAETQEVLAGYWIVECESIDRATEIAARLGQCPYPGDVYDNAYADIRPIMESADDMGF
ncbi:YciI family protein [Nonomuraea sp. 10N515B]|uniref:YciI family protein n=1 Tax=Nonomuraea sp. 10N515B TaxID=3457422 RepID=UPI003FCE5FEF